MNDFITKIGCVFHVLFTFIMLFYAAALWTSDEIIGKISINVTNAGNFQQKLIFASMMQKEQCLGRPEFHKVPLKLMILYSSNRDETWYFAYN